MGFFLNQIEQVFNAGKPAPDDDYWYRPFGQESATGLRLVEADMLKASTVLACIRVLSEAVAALPLVMFERVTDGKRQIKRRAPGHPLYALLHDQPNPQMTAFEFWQLAMVFATLWGTFYAEIRPGARGFVDQLIPLHTDRVTTERLRDGRLRYRVRDEGSAAVRVLLQEDVFRISGLSLDGLIGARTLDLVRETVALALAAETYAANMFRNSAVLGVVLEVDGKLRQEDKAALREAWDARHVGAGKMHSTAVLDGGLKAKTLPMDAKAAQLNESRTEQALEICRALGVPPSKIGILDVATYTIEQQAIAFVQDALAPWLRRIAQAIARDLILAPERFFAEFIVDARMWADSATRAAFYGSGIQNGWLTRNEVRVLENLNPLDGLDEPLSPLNMRQGANAPQPRRGEQPPPRGRRQTEESEEDAAPGAYKIPATDMAAAVMVHAMKVRARQIALAAAQRVVRREVEEIAKAAARHAGDAAAWAAWVEEFYAGHTRFVMQALVLTPGHAQTYIEGQKRTLLSGGVAVIETWPVTAAEALANLAIHEEAA